MQKRSINLFLSTSVFIVAMASFSFAGNSQCPDHPPIPGEGGRVSAHEPHEPHENTAVKDDYQILKGIWDFISLHSDLF